MSGFNTIPVDSAGAGCGQLAGSRPVDNAPEDAQPGAAATFRIDGTISRFNRTNTTGCNAGILSLFNEKQQQIS